MHKRKESVYITACYK